VDNKLTCTQAMAFINVLLEMGFAWLHPQHHLMRLTNFILSKVTKPVLVTEHNRSFREGADRVCAAPLQGWPGEEATAVCASQRCQKPRVGSVIRMVLLFERFEVSSYHGMAYVQDISPACHFYPCDIFNFQHNL
jgi:hypothetical protein